MADQAAILQELRRRQQTGSFNPQQRAAFTELERRGVFGGAPPAAAPNITPPTAGGPVEPELVEFARRNPGTKLDLSDYNQVDPAGGRTQLPTPTPEQEAAVARRTGLPTDAELTGLSRRVTSAFQPTTKVGQAAGQLLIEEANVTPIEAAGGYENRGTQLRQQALERTPRAVRPVATGVTQSALTSAALLAQVTDALGATDQNADALTEEAATLSTNRQALGTSVFENAAEGVTRSLVDLITVGRVLPGGSGGRLAQAAPAITGFTLKAMNDAEYEGKQAGLSGPALGRYIMTQGAIEGGVTAMFSMIGLGGLENAALKETGKQAFKQALKAVGKSVGGELLEENTIGILSAVSRQLEGVDPQALTAENLEKLVFDTTLSTLMTMGLVEGGSRAVDASRARQQKAAASEPVPNPEVRADNPTLDAVVPEHNAAPDVPAVPQPNVVSDDGLRSVFSVTNPNAKVDAEAYAADLRKTMPDALVAVNPLPRRSGFEVVITEGGQTAVDRQAEIDTLTQTQQRKLVRQARAAGLPVRNITDVKALSPADFGRIGATPAQETAQDAIAAPEPAPATVGPDRRQEGPSAAQTGQQERRSERGDRRSPDLTAERQQITSLIQTGRVDEAQALIGQLQDRARRDPKGTGLLSGTEFDNQMADIKADIDAGGKPRHIASLDVANLGLSNTVRGHQRADQDLARIAKAVLDIVGPEASFRTGGDEVGVIFPEGTSRSQAHGLLRKIEEAVGFDEIVPGASMFLAGQVGTVSPGQSIQDVLTEIEHKGEEKKRQIKASRGEPTSISKDEAKRLADQLANPATRPIDPDDPADQPGEFKATESEPVVEMLLPVPETVRAQWPIRQWVSKNLTPVGTTLRNWAPRLYGRLKQHQAAYRRDRHDADYQVHKFEQQLKALSTEDRKQFFYLIQTQRPEEARRILDRLENGSEILEQLDTVVRIKNRWHAEGQDAGLQIGTIEGHWPRQVKPGMYDEWSAQLTGEERDELDRMIAKEAARKGRPLSAGEEGDIANKWFAGYRHLRAGETSPRILSRRTVDDLSYENWEKYYDTTMQPVYAYFDRLIYNTHKARLFGKQSAEESLDESVGRLFVEGKYGLDKLTPYQRNRVRSAIQSIYTGGEQSPHAVFRFLRDLGYAGTLLDPSSAAIQFGDLALIAARDGVTPLLRALPKAAREEVLTAKNLGLEHLSEEYGSHGKLSNALRFGFKAVGFTYIDTKALTVSMVSAVNQAKRTVKSEDGVQRLADEWGAVFGADFPALVRDLRAGVVSNVVADYAYLMASETRPIDMLDMPENYANHPNWRIAWQLKGFAMKQFDFIKRRAYNKIAQGVRRRDPKLAAAGVGELVRLLMMLSLAGATFDWLRDWALGRNPDFTDSMINGLLYTHLGSTYLLGIASDDGPGSAALEFITPPAFDMSDQIWRDFANGTFKSVKYLPFGKTLYSWTGTHAEEQAGYARKESLKRASDAWLRGDRAAARTYINAFNSEMRDRGREERLSVTSVIRSATQRERNQKDD